MGLSLDNGGGVKPLPNTDTSNPPASSKKTEQGKIPNQLATKTGHSSISHDSKNGSTDNLGVATLKQPPPVPPKPRKLQGKPLTDPSPASTKAQSILRTQSSEDIYAVPDKTKPNVKATEQELAKETFGHTGIAENPTKAFLHAKNDYQAKAAIYAQIQLEKQTIEREIGKNPTPEQKKLLNQQEIKLLTAQLATAKAGITALKEKMVFAEGPEDAARLRSTQATTLKLSIHLIKKNISMLKESKEAGELSPAHEERLASMETKLQFLTTQVKTLIASNTTLPKEQPSSPKMNHTIQPLPIVPALPPRIDSSTIEPKHLETLPPLPHELPPLPHATIAAKVAIQTRSITEAGIAQGVAKEAAETTPPKNSNVAFKLTSACEEAYTTEVTFNKQLQFMIRLQKHLTPEKIQQLAKGLSPEKQSEFIETFTKLLNGGNIQFLEKASTELLNKLKPFQVAVDAAKAEAKVIIDHLAAAENDLAMAEETGDQEKIGQLKTKIEELKVQLQEKNAKIDAATIPYAKALSSLEFSEGLTKAIAGHNFDFTLLNVLASERSFKSAWAAVMKEFQPTAEESISQEAKTQFNNQISNIANPFMPVFQRFLKYEGLSGAITKNLGKAEEAGIAIGDLQEDSKAFQARAASFATDLNQSQKRLEMQKVIDAISLAKKKNGKLSGNDAKRLHFKERTVFSKLQGSKGNNGAEVLASTRAFLKTNIDSLKAEIVIEQDPAKKKQMVDRLATYLSASVDLESLPWTKEVDAATRAKSKEERKIESAIKETRADAHIITVETTPKAA